VAESLKQDEALISIGGVHILYDASLIEHPDASLFDINRQSQSATGMASGRSHAVFFSHQGNDLVLKHYERGGKIALLLGDKYLGRQIDRSRCFKEWRLLKKMRAMELPVPEPVAAKVAVKGLFYRADLITREIKQAETLADYLLRQSLDEDKWRAVGKCIRRFHDASVYHADLNARNILLANEGQSVKGESVYLIDFDKGQFRYMSDKWKPANLARLQRSLNKFKTHNTSFHFEAVNWQQLVDGYSGVDD
jgi:3-deoxy-D-manno-octulosonic acid kinase